MCRALYGVLCSVKRNSWGQEGGLKNQRLRGKQETKLGIRGEREVGIFYGATQSITYKCTFLFLSGIIKKACIQVSIFTPAENTVTTDHTMQQ